MKTSELKLKTSLELELELEASCREKINLRMQKGSSNNNKGPNINKFKQIRRKCARIKTILNERKRESHEQK